MLQLWSLLREREAIVEERFGGDDVVLVVILTKSAWIQPDLTGIAKESEHHDFARKSTDWYGHATASSEEIGVTNAKDCGEKWSPECGTRGGERKIGGYVGEEKERDWLGKREKKIFKNVFKRVFGSPVWTQIFEFKLN